MQNLHRANKSIEQPFKRIFYDKWKLIAREDKSVFCTILFYQELAYIIFAWWGGESKEENSVYTHMGNIFLFPYFPHKCSDEVSSHDSLLSF